MVKERPTKARHPRKERSHHKIFWDRGYNNWSESKFKEHLTVDRGTFELILNRVSANIYKTPINMKPNPSETHRQLGMILYRLSYGCSSWVIYDLFQVTIWSVVAIFNKVLWEMILQLFNEYVYMPTIEEEWRAECKGFIENYEFT